MNKAFHRLITLQALESYFSRSALEVIIAANLSLDALSGQIGHNEYHFDANAFEPARAFIEENRKQIRPALEEGNLQRAWQAFGRLTHTAQDFYAHSNYVSLWLERFPSNQWPPPEAIDALDPSLLDSPALRSGKLYYPLEALSFIPKLKKWILPLLPRDSHAWMNLDSPEQGPQFAYALAAAIQRTRYEYHLSTANLPPELCQRFHGS
ncbi:MAG: hypothetical protein N2049_03755 [Anaerolineales bacterium]|nr:hypothetical protein [Anaerolineales bacterium]MCX7608319.1 hypothetical protein [Anaerolineales bacterium]MDW8227348.1 hypothetical protein [Anaerolineales bacterium]